MNSFKKNATGQNVEKGPRGDEFERLCSRSVIEGTLCEGFLCHHITRRLRDQQESRADLLLCVYAWRGLARRAAANVEEPLYLCETPVGAVTTTHWEANETTLCHRLRFVVGMV